MTVGSGARLSLFCEGEGIVVGAWGSPERADSAR